MNAQQASSLVDLLESITGLFRTLIAQVRVNRDAVINMAERLDKLEKPRASARRRGARRAGKRQAPRPPARSKP